MYSRDITNKLGTYNPGFDTKPHNADYRSKGTLDQLPLGYDASGEAQQIHHIMGLQEHLRPLIQNLPEHKQLGIIQRLLSKGVPVGNDPANLIALNTKDHKVIHDYMKQVGLESNNELDKKKFQDQLTQLSYDDRLIAADTFAEQLYPAIIEKLHLMGYKVPTTKQNVDRYLMSVQDEIDSETKSYVRELMIDKYGAKPTMANIKKIVEDETLPPRMAGDVMRGLMNKSADDISTTDLGKSVNIFADKVIMEKAINGNGKRKV